MFGVIMSMVVASEEFNKIWNGKLHSIQSLWFLKHEPLNGTAWALDQTRIDILLLKVIRIRTVHLLKNSA